MLERLPEQARTPAVVRAIMSPSGILLAGAGTAVGVIAGAGLPLALVLGGVAWAARVGIALARRPRPERIEPFTIQDPWRTLVRRAVSTSTRFQEAVRQTQSGPLRDRLGEVGARVKAAEREAWAIAKRGHALDRGLRELGLEDVRRQLAEVEARPRGGAEQEPLVQALRNQLESGERLQAVATDAEARLRRINAQLDEAAARAVELSLQAADVEAFQPLGSDVEGLVGELESLRQALEEAG